MSRGLNKAMIIGNVGNVDVRYGSTGEAIANLSIATSESWKDKQTGEKKERVEWHRVVIYGKLGEIVDRYVKKGSRLYVEGSIRTNKWTDNSGNDRYTTEIVGRDMQMLDSRGDATAEEMPAKPAEETSVKPAEEETPVKPAEKVEMPQTEMEEDDIPF